jgi:ABC-type microcin C transport system permease subunit YejB
LALVATAIIALAYALPWWLAALIVGVVVTGGGLFLVQRGIAALRTESLVPQQTLATLKEDAQWAKEQVS